MLYVLAAWLMLGLVSNWFYVRVMGDLYLGSFIMNLLLGPGSFVASAVMYLDKPVPKLLILRSKK